MIREHLHQIFRLSCHGWNHHFPPFIKGRGELNNQNFCKKRGGLDSSHKKVGFGKIGEKGCFKKWGESLVIITNPFHCYLPLIVWCVCVCVCVLFIYTISISIICVSLEELSFIESNQHIYDFYKWVIFEKKRHCGKTLISNFWYQ